jgi:sensor histidine kinase YesM
MVFDTIEFMENRRKSTNYFPEPRFQFRFLRFLLIGSALQVTTTCSILYYFLQQNYRLLVQYAGLDQEIVSFLHRELNVLITIVGVTFALYLVGVAMLGLLFSHRIAGVVYAMKRTIKDLNEGKDVELKTRHGDEFQELTDSFNALIHRLKNESLSQKQVR